MPRLKEITKPEPITYKQLQIASGLCMADYARLMRTHISGVYYRASTGAIKPDTYTELALLHADAHPFFKLVLRETGEI
jgi:hypothetical protein